MTTPDYITVLHKELCKLTDKKDALEAKYPVGFGLHKTRQANAQKDKRKWLSLQQAINDFHGVLRYYGYSIVHGNKLILEAA